MFVDDITLESALRRWRAAKANRERVEAYRIIPNAAINDLVARRPRTLLELLDVKGIGANRANKYGPELLAIIRQACGEQGPAPPDVLDLTATPLPHAQANAFKPWTIFDIQRLKGMYEEGLGLKAIASQLGRSAYAVQCRLEKMGLRPPPYDTARHASPVRMASLF